MHIQVWDQGTQLYFVVQRNISSAKANQGPQSNCQWMYELKVFNGVWKIKYNLPRFSIIVYHQNGVLQQPITVEGTHGI